ncbi:hypothetical protein OA85_01675 [Flavobacterium sp. AED]|nr:hypothetical protein OA85_01675 [Flavobacterium sp. AED]
MKYLKVRFQISDFRFQIVLKEIVFYTIKVAKILINFCVTKLLWRKSLLSFKWIFYLEFECLILPQNPSPDSSENPLLFFFKTIKIETNSWK